MKTIKRPLIFLVLFLINNYIWGQETKFILKTNTSFSEEYYVLKDNDKVKHGTYLRYTKGLSGFRILQSGNYSNGLKSGEWKYFSNRKHNTVIETGNYANGKRNGVWVLYHLDTVPHIANWEEHKGKRKVDSIEVTIEHRSARLKAVGSYLNDKRIGEWTSFDYDGNVYQKYNFSKKRLSFDKTIGDTILNNTNRPALFIGGEQCLIPFIFETFDFLKFVPSASKDSVSVVVSFNIHTNGTISKLEISESNIGEPFMKEALNSVSLTDDYWIPALKEGYPVDSTYRLRFYTIIKKGTSFSMESKSRVLPLFP